MHKHKIAFLLSLTVVIAASGTTITAFRSYRQDDRRANPARKSQKMIEHESQFPVADYSEPESTDPKERAKKEAKAKKYSKTELSIDPDSDAVTTSIHWAAGLPAIPVSQSAVIVTGIVSRAKAALTRSREKVYSEFTITIDEVLKNDALTPLSSGSITTVDRAGGRVRFPSGRVGLYSIVGQGMPQVGRKYILFLTKSDPEAGFSILTGYEMRDDHIYLLDNPGDGHPITTTEGIDEHSFLNQVRAAIAGS